MKVSELLDGINYEGFFTDVDVLNVTDDSRKVVKGSAFVCIKGLNFDGHTKASDAILKGASVIISEEPTGVPNEVVVKNSRSAYALICANFFGKPSEKIKIIGITGTNGKTSTAFILSDILNRVGRKCGIIGTVKNFDGEKCYPSHLTTPDPIELSKLFSDMVKNECEYCVMEVSSQALDQRRLEGINFELAIFTNLTEDHLDYHKNFDNYLKAKRILFTQAKNALVNVDDVYAQNLIEGLHFLNLKKYSIDNNDADFIAKNIVYEPTKVRYEIMYNNELGRCCFAAPGKFSVYNSLAAVSAALMLGILFDKIQDALKVAQGVKGRAEVVETGTDYTILIDYAHTPDGLENILNAVKQNANGKIITVFGCGGDRDKTKRPLMGEAVGNISDIAVITSDNPRTEAPEKIIDDIIPGVIKTKAKYKVVINRTEAIRYALKIAKKDDVVILAGKGHEDYQIIGTEKIHYDEREIIKDILSGKI